jgi:hypothetical protein
VQSHGSGNGGQTAIPSAYRCSVTVSATVTLHSKNPAGNDTHLLDRVESLK